MIISKIFLKTLIIICILPILLNSCANRGDARKSPPDPKLRVKKNLEEGRGFRLMDAVKKEGSTNYQFASSNELWRATLDTLDFMPLSSVNYSGGIIVTDWYYDNNNSDESIKISVRFLTNEIRSDSLDIKIFKKLCTNQNKCKIIEGSDEVESELELKILKIAKTYELQNKDKNKKPYKHTEIKN